MDSDKKYSYKGNEDKVYFHISNIIYSYKKDENFEQLLNYTDFDVGILHNIIVVYDHNSLSGKLDHVIKYIIDNNINLEDEINGYESILRYTNLLTVEMSKYIIDKFSDITKKFTWEDTPLHIISKYSSVDILQYILEKEGVDVNSINNLGNNPLMSIIENHLSGDYFKKIDILLQYGTDVLTRNNEGKTVFDMTNDPDLLSLFDEYNGGIATKAGTEKKMNILIFSYSFLFHILLIY